MQPSLSSDQQEILRTIRQLIRSHRAHEGSPTQGVVESRTFGALRDGGYLDLDSGLDRATAALIVEASAHERLLAPIATRLLVGPTLQRADLPGRLAILGQTTGGVVRYGADVDAFVMLRSDSVHLVDVGDCEISPVRTRYHYPYARVGAGAGEMLSGVQVDEVASAWRLAIAAELSGLMIAAVEHTAAYVKTREQFGRPIGSLQGVQQKLAVSYVLAEGARWLSRRAACTPDDQYLSACAASFACYAASSVYLATHQVSGAMGITNEHGLVGWTMRILALSQEFGGQRSHASAVTNTRGSSPSPLFGPKMETMLSELAQDQGAGQRVPSGARDQWR
jgi:hypothetical protein